MKLRDRGFVSIELDKERHLKIDFRAARLIEEKLELPITKLAQESVGIKQMIVMFWAALAHEKLDNWTLERAEELMMEAESVEDVMTKVGEALTLFFSNGQKPEKN